MVYIISEADINDLEITRIIFHPEADVLQTSDTECNNNLPRKFGVSNKRKYYESPPPIKQAKGQR